MKQLIVCGAKLHTVMKRLFATEPAPIDGEVETDVLVDWLLAAVASAVVCEQAQRQHGQIAYACGPTAFLIALGVINRIQPREDATPSIMFGSPSQYRLLECRGAVLRRIRQFVGRSYLGGRHRLKLNNFDSM